MDEDAQEAMLDRDRCLQNAPLPVAAILEAAFEEDRREGGRFDAQGFSNFSQDETNEDVRAAWLIYDEYWSRRRDAHALLCACALLKRPSA
jgi:hypothetical protein